MNGVSFSWTHDCRRVEHDDVAASVGPDAGGQLVDQDVLARLERPLHRLLLHLVRLSDEVLDEQEDDEREDKGLDDLQETAEGGSFGHKAGV